MNHPAVAVNVVIKDDTDRVLLKREGTSWTLPGGYFDGGDDWLQALGKHAKSVGVVVKGHALVGLYSQPCLVVTFLVTKFDGSPSPEACEWFGSDRLPDSLSREQMTQVTNAVSFKGEVFVR